MTIWYTNSGRIYYKNNLTNILYLRLQAINYCVEAMDMAYAGRLWPKSPWWLLNKFLKICHLVYFLFHEHQRPHRFTRVGCLIHLKVLYFSSEETPRAPLICIWFDLEIRTWKSNYTHCFALDVITHPYPNFSGGKTKPPLIMGHCIRPWASYYTPLFSCGCNYLSMS